MTVYPLQWALMKGKRGRPPQPKVIPDPALLYGQVVKEREGRKVVKVEKRLVLGPPATALSQISTSLLERQNGTARSRNRYLVRKTYAFAKLVEYMDDQCEVDKTIRFARASSTCSEFDLRLLQTLLNLSAGYLIARGVEH